MASQPVFQFMARLAGSQPESWRRFQVLSGYSLGKVGFLVLCMFEMTGGRPFTLALPMQANVAARGFPPEVWSAFEERVLYQVAGPEGLPEDPEEEIGDAEVRLREVMRRPGETLRLEYAAEKPWTVVCTLEAILRDPGLSGLDLPRVTAGEGCGIREPGPVWEGSPPQPSAAPEPFQQEDLNRRLRRVARILSDFYRHDLPPTRKDQDFLDRKYRRA